MFLKTYLRTKRIYNRKIIIPFMRSEKPLNEIALGVQIGIFWGMTPTAGFQIYIVLLQWLIKKYIFKKKFDIPLAITMIWISNPLTIVPLYILFFKTGSFLLAIFNYDLPEILFSDIINNFTNTISAKNINFIEKSFLLLRFLLNRWVFIAFLGSLIYAIPCSFLGYYFTKKILYPFKETRKKRKSKNLQILK